jgi:hypothetical protein
MTINWDRRGTIAIGSIDGEDRYMVCDVRQDDDPPEQACVLATRLPIPRNRLGHFFWSFSRAMAFCEMNERGGGWTSTGTWVEMPYDCKM